MRTGGNRPGSNMLKNFPQYSPVMNPAVKCFTEHLRKAGYYCLNKSKEDYQFATLLAAWDAKGGGANFNKIPKGKPFFAVFNFGVTHESQIWKRSKKPQTVDPSKVSIPPYYPDTPTVRKDIARMYSNIEELDRQINKLLKGMEAKGQKV